MTVANAETPAHRGNGDGRQDRDEALGGGLGRSNGGRTSNSQASKARAKEWRLRRGGVDIRALMQATEFDRYIRDRYGAQLPDDDAGRDDLEIGLQLRAPLGRGELDLRAYARRLAPWSVGELTELIDAAYTRPRRFTPDQLGARIGITDADRTRLGFTTIGGIDVGKEARLARRKAKDRAYQEAKRRANGATPRAQSATRSQPWVMEGISRRTWYRRRAKSVGTNSSAAKQKNLMSADELVPPFMLWRAQPARAGPSAASP